MAAPNLLSPTTVTGKTAVYPVTTSLAQALSNGASSNKAFKVLTIRAANVDGTNPVDLSVSLFRSSTHTYLAKTVPIPADATVIILSRDDLLYMEEGDALFAQASANSRVELTISYEEVA